MFTGTGDKRGASVAGLDDAERSRDAASSASALAVTTTDNELVERERHQQQQLQAQLRPEAQALAQLLMGHMVTNNRNTNARLDEIQEEMTNQLNTTANRLDTRVDSITVRITALEQQRAVAGTGGAPSSASTLGPSASQSREIADPEFFIPGARQNFTGYDSPQKRKVMVVGGSV